MESSYRPIVGVTMGDPVGIGPEILCMAFDRPEVFENLRPLVIGDVDVLKKAAAVLGVNISPVGVDSPDQGVYAPGRIDVIQASRLDAESLQWGQPTRETGCAMIDYINMAVDLATAEHIDAVATCPINKAAMKLAGSDFHGHTELLAARTNTDVYAMMMAGPRLRVVLVTIHMPLKAVSRLLTTRSIETIISLTDRSLKTRFGIASPTIAVAGFNPHAGEEDMFGSEESEIIHPAVHNAASHGIRATGPLPPDTLFYHAASGAYDAVVCMYHDQGLIPFKMIHFTDGVNTTLGLPIVRTSVDHGTAYDIAGQGKAEPGSLLAAMAMAARQALCLNKGAKGSQ